MSSLNLWLGRTPESRSGWLILLAFLFCSIGSCQTPPNDNFTNATVLYGSSAIFSGTLSNATLESGESSTGCSIYSYSGGSVWWSWTPTNPTTVVIDVLASTGTTFAALIVGTGSSVSSLTDVVCLGLDNVPNRNITFAVTSGTTYHLRVLGTDRSFTLRLTATNAPVIISPPQSQTIPENTGVMFGVIAGGLPPLSYQWRFAGQPLPGQTAPILLLYYPTASRAGEYSVVVTNGSGFTTTAAANLTISPTSPPLVLAPVSSFDPNSFSFSLAGETGHLYRVWATTNLVDWLEEQTISPRLYHNVVQNMNATSVYSLPIMTGQKFLRASHDSETEICIAQLQAIAHAIKLWALQNRKSATAQVTEQDIVGYLNGSSLACPTLGTTFAQTYSITDVQSLPQCEIIPTTHKLPQ